MAKSKRGKMAYLKNLLGINNAAKQAPVAKAPVAKAPVAKAPVAKATSGKDHWFERMTPVQQKAYIKAHPRSKYAKQAGKGVKPVNKAGVKPVNKAGKEKLDVIRTELAALQKKKSTMDPQVYKGKLQTLRARIAHAAGTAKPKIGVKKPSKKSPVKTQHHIKAAASVKSAAAAKKAHHIALKDITAKLKEAKASKRPNTKKIAALEAAHKKTSANKKKAAAQHAVAKTRLNLHSEKHKAKLNENKAKAVKKVPAKAVKKVPAKAVKKVPAKAKIKRRIS